MPQARHGVNEPGRLARGENVDGAAQPGARELTLQEEALGIGLPGVGEHVEALVEAQLGMRVELGGEAVGVGTGATVVCRRRGV